MRFERSILKEGYHNCVQYRMWLVSLGLLAGPLFIFKPATLAAIPILACILSFVVHSTVMARGTASQRHFHGLEKFALRALLLTLPAFMASYAASWSRLPYESPIYLVGIVGSFIIVLFAALSLAGTWLTACFTESDQRLTSALRRGSMMILYTSPRLFICWIATGAVLALGVAFFIYFTIWLAFGPMFDFRGLASTAIWSVLLTILVGATLTPIFCSVIFSSIILCRTYLIAESELPGV
jgi:hypothetical protein